MFSVASRVPRVTRELAIVRDMSDKPLYHRTYIKEWRNKRGLSLRRLAERLEQTPGGDLMLSHTSIGRIEKIDLLTGDGPKGAAQIVIDEATILLPLSGLIDVEKERARLKKDFDKAAGEGEKIAKKLGNAQFVAKADPEVVEEQRQRLVEIEQMQGKLKQALERLAAI